jgi:ion channel-forming bestrophin family protein
MISYNPRNWSRILFRIPKSDTIIRLMPLILFICFYSAFIAYLELEYFHLRENHWLRSTPQMHTLLGFAISMLLVFRTNTAYDRWWEGRKLWGALVNNSRNLAIKLSSFLKKDDDANRAFFRQLISQFPFELMSHLQEERSRTSILPGMFLLKLLP